MQFLCWSLAFANKLNAREELTQIVQVGLPDQVVSLRDVMLPIGPQVEGTLQMGALHELASLLDHYNAVVDQVAHLDKLSCCVLHHHFIWYSIFCENSELYLPLKILV